MWPFKKKERKLLMVVNIGLSKWAVMHGDDYVCKGYGEGNFYKFKMPEHVNKHCLFDTEQGARDLALDFKQVLDLPPITQSYEV